MNTYFRHLCKKWDSDFIHFTQNKTSLPVYSTLMSETMYLVLYYKDNHAHYLHTNTIWCKHFECGLTLLRHFSSCHFYVYKVLIFFILKYDLNVDM